MGAWGYGPFDSDSGCDYLLRLEKSIDPFTQLRILLADVDKYLDVYHYECQEIYAGIGLVCALLHPGKHDVPEGNKVVFSDEELQELRRWCLRATEALRSSESGMYKAIAEDETGHKEFIKHMEVLYQQLM
jgi:Domain of unknown function (DUF4259)